MCKFTEIVLIRASSNERGESKCESVKEFVMMRSFVEIGKQTKSGIFYYHEKLCADDFVSLILIHFPPLCVSLPRPALRRSQIPMVAAHISCFVTVVAASAACAAAAHTKRTHLGENAEKKSDATSINWMFGCWCVLLHSKPDIARQ